MSYYYIPVQWNNPTDADFDEFDRALSRLPADRVLIHCAANFRVTAFYSLYAQQRLGWSEARADDVPRRHLGRERLPDMGRRLLPGRRLNYRKAPTMTA